MRKMKSSPHKQPLTVPQDTEVAANENEEIFSLFRKKLKFYGVQSRAGCLPGRPKAVEKEFR